MSSRAKHGIHEVVRETDALPTILDRRRSRRKRPNEAGSRVRWSSRFIVFALRRWSSRFIVFALRRWSSRFIVFALRRWSSRFIVFALREGREKWKRRGNTLNRELRRGGNTLKL
jgi:hypothetical protein